MSLVLISLSFVFLALARSPGADAQPWRLHADQELARLCRVARQVAVLLPSGAPAGQRREKVQDSVNNTLGNTKLKEHGVQDWVIRGFQVIDLARSKVRRPRKIGNCPGAASLVLLSLGFGFLALAGRQAPSPSPGGRVQIKRLRGVGW